MPVATDIGEQFQHGAEVKPGDHWQQQAIAFSILAATCPQVRVVIDVTVKRFTLGLHGENCAGGCILLKVHLGLIPWNIDQVIALYTVSIHVKRVSIRDAALVLALTKQ